MAQHVELSPLEALAATLRGDVITPSSPEYEKAIVVWNWENKKRPQAIFRVLGVSDVRKVLKFISTCKPVPFTVKGGGHSLKCMSDGFVIDLGRMRGCSVDPKTQTAVVEGGSLLLDIYREAAEFGLFLPAGVVSDTGVGGLTLFGGVGWMCREFGLACDHVLEVELVTAEGEVLRVNTEENEDLFWGVRGAGGCFGVVTSFKFRLVQSTSVYAGLMLYPWPKYAELFSIYRQYTLDDEKFSRKEGSNLLAMSDPQGNKMAVLLTCHHGSEQEWKANHQPFIEAAPFFSRLQQLATVDWFCGNDFRAKTGHWYQKGINTDHLTPELCEIISNEFEKAPTKNSTVLILPFGGKISDVPEADTAYCARKARFGINIECRWEDPADGEKTIQWARAFYEKLVPFKSSSTYINFTADSTLGGKEYFGKNFEKLQELKKKYDPNGVFRSVISP